MEPLDAERSRLARVSVAALSSSSYPGICQAIAREKIIQRLEVARCELDRYCMRLER